MSIMRAAVAFLVLLLFAGCPAFADDISLSDELAKLKARIDELEKRLAAQEKCIKDQDRCILAQEQKIASYEEKLSQFDSQLHRQTGAPIAIAEGLEIGAGATMIVQGTSNTNNADPAFTKKESRADASYSTDITLGKSFGDINGKAFLHLEAGEGNGLDDDLTLYSGTNRDADNDNNVRVTELWYEQRFGDEKAALTFGKLDPTAYFDNNEAANDETSQFLAPSFCNSPVIEFPDNTAGVRLAYLPAGWLAFGYGVFDADGDWEKIGDNLFNIGQVTVKTDLFGKPGNYRFYAWSNHAHHTEWLNADKTKEYGYGFGLSFDQKVADAVTLFTRYGWQDPKVYDPSVAAAGGLNYSLEHAWSAGLQVVGKTWGREKDAFAFAVGQIFPSDDYKEAGVSQGIERKAKAEGHLEAYYRVYINDHLSISPDFQYIWNPFGRDVADDTDNIFIGGIRTQVDF